METFITQLQEIDAKIDALLANDTLTDEQQLEHDRLVGERKQVAAKIKKEQDKAAREQERQRLEEIATSQRAVAEERARRVIPAAAEPASSPLPGRLTTPDAPTAGPASAAQRLTIPATVRRYGHLKNFRGQRNGQEADVRAYRFGMFGLAMLALNMPGRFAYLPGFKQALGFFEHEWGGPQAVHNSNDSTGAQFLIPEEFSLEMVNLKEIYGVARRLLRNEPMMSDTKSIPRRTGGLTAYFVTEGAPASESNKQWDQVRLTAKDMMVLSRISGQVNADAAINFGDDLAGEISYAFAQKEDDCAFNGLGTGAYGGIVGIRTKLDNIDGAGTDSFGLVQQGTGNTLAAIVLSDFNAVLGRLPQYADTPNACWVCHKTFYATVMQKLELAAGGNTANEIANGDRRPRPVFLGYPVEFSQVFPSATAVATCFCILGDLTLGCAFGDRQQDTIAFSEHAAVTNGGVLESVFERNQIAIRGTERFDINIHDVGNATTAGPTVGLKTGP